jgi:tetratricopeptide (TPR) repeat protein
MDSFYRKPECRRIMSMHSFGEHKAVVETYRDLETAGDSCSEEVQKTVALSRSKLNTADDLVRRAFRQIDRGELLEAKANLNQALRIYPRYYWVSKLLRDLDRSIQLRAERLQREAQYLEVQGDLSEALTRIKQANELLGGNEELKGEARRLELALQARSVREGARQELARARQYLDQGRFLDAEKVLQEGKARSVMPGMVSRFTNEIRAKRQLRGREAYRDARASEVAGDLDQAYYHIGVALGHGPLEDPLRSDVVEFARLLGMKYYSQGKLTQALSVWSLALKNDAGNEKLTEYVDEVRARLENLKKIQEQEGNGPTKQP